jgi:hypothetical protein
MSWSINVRGTKEQVKEAVEKHQINTDFPEVEQEQQKRAVELLKLTLENVPVAEGKGFDVNAYGHCDTVDGVVVGNRVSVKIETINLEQ